MQSGDGDLERAFDPLRIVDVKTLTSIAESLKKSNSKKKRAVGVFLDRINRYRIGDGGEQDKNAPTGPAERQSPTRGRDTPRDHTSGLRDLVE